MAKKSKANDTTAVTGDNGSVPESVADVIITDASTGRTIRFGDLPVKSQARLVTKGANEILTDSGAFSKEQVAKFESEGVLDSKKAEARDKRWNSLLTGEFAVGMRGPRVDESTRVYNEVIAERFAAWWNAQRKAGTKMGDGKDYPALSNVKADSLKGLHARWEAVVIAPDKDNRTESVIAREVADRRIAEKADATGPVAFVVSGV